MMKNSYSQNSNEKLLKEIKEKRHELISLAAKDDLTSNLVVKCSQELDLLIYEMLTLNRQVGPNVKFELRTMDGIH
jgi:hypothetical protein